MPTITLSMKQSITVPLEAENITPDNLAGKSVDEIKAVTVYHGNSEAVIGDFFDVTVEGSGNDPASTEIIIKGDLTRVKRIGEGMSAGSIVIEGDCDMHCGAFMRGGKITVKGNADAWAGREMRGGEIIIEGDAGNYVGSAYRGELTGMRGGKIVVEGNAGDYLGEHLGGGEIIVKGNTGVLPGLS
ncbi:formylmethanofuran dehydrogenase subunit C, partial [Methanosarcinales archaeon]